jgi:hypothetical protein
MTFGPAVAQRTRDKKRSQRVQQALNTVPTM